MAKQQRPLRDFGMLYALPAFLLLLSPADPANWILVQSMRTGYRSIRDKPEPWTAGDVQL